MGIQATLQGRYDRYIGIVSPPASFECSPQHLLDVTAGSAGVVQHLCHMPDFVYGEDSGNTNLQALEAGAAAMAAAFCEVIAQVGGYWALSMMPTEKVARELASRLSDRHGVPVILVWNAVIDALRSIGARRITVATGYYRPDWTAAAVSLLKGAGFDVLWSGDVIDQGILPDEAAKLDIEAKTRWDYPDNIVREACLDAARRAPKADAVVQIGAGFRPVYQAATIERDTGLPLIATDNALYWAILKEAELSALLGFGSLLDDLSVVSANAHI